MEDCTSISQFVFEKKTEKEAVDQLIEKLLTDNKIVDVRTDDESISLEYYQQLTSREQLRFFIENFGFELKAEEAVEDTPYEKNPFKRFINRMAASNEKNFGNQRLDCCNLHK